jgi:hypothetical protein
LTAAFLPAKREVKMAIGKTLSQAEQVAESCGIILGAASHCEQISEERLNSAADKVRDFVTASANDAAEVGAANARFDAAIDAGKHAAELGQVNLDAAENALVEIEEQLTR